MKREKQKPTYDLASRVRDEDQNGVTQLRGIPKAISIRNAICDTLGGAIRDTRVRFGNPIGRFVDEAAFNQVLRSPDDPARTGHRMFFTHADLIPENTPVDEAVQQDGSLGWRVTVIEDWEMAGYYPECWEYTKALYERFRWTRWDQSMIRRLFRQYSKKFDVERRSCEVGI